MLQVHMQSHYVTHPVALCCSCGCAGTRNLAWSKYLLPSESERRLPTLAETNHEGRSLKGTVSQLCFVSCVLYAVTAVLGWQCLISGCRDQS
jgi:hypothetical protein